MKSFKEYISEISWAALAKKAPPRVKEMDDDYTRLKKKSIKDLKAEADQVAGIHSAVRKAELIDVIMRATYGKKDFDAYNLHFYGD